MDYLPEEWRRKKTANICFDRDGVEYKVFCSKAPFEFWPDWLNKSNYRHTKTLPEIKNKRTWVMFEFGEWIIKSKEGTFAMNDREMARFVAGVDIKQCFEFI